jgi:hypothetical protein
MDAELSSLGSFLCVGLVYLFGVVVFLLNLLRLHTWVMVGLGAVMMVVSCLLLDTNPSSLWAILLFLLGVSVYGIAGVRLWFDVP